MPYGVKERFWVPFPELGVEVAQKIFAYITSGPGCHTRMITNVTTGGFDYGNIESVRPLDGGKLPSKFVDKYYSHMTTDAFRTAFLMTIGKKDWAPPELEAKLKPSLYKALADATENPLYKAGIYIISDTLNWNTKARSASPGTYKTAEFVKWLIENRVGHVTASPITNNPNHSVPGNYSLVQAWFWIPPSRLKHTLAGTQRYYNNDALPDWNTVYKTYSRECDQPVEKLDAYLWGKEGMKIPVPNPEACEIAK